MPFRSNSGTMPPLLAWTGEVKSDLLDYAGKHRFRQAYEQAFLDHFGDLMTANFADQQGKALNTGSIDESGDPLGLGGISEFEFGNFLDAFILEHRLPDGRTIVDHYVADHPKLAAEQRDVLRSWQDVVEGVFLIERNEGTSLRLRNLIDDLPYHAFANAGAQAIKDMKRGMYLASRLVPLGDDWLLSGYQQLLPAAGRQEIYLTAMSIGISNPRLVFRNPALLEQGWDLQRRDRAAFIAYFGSDLIVLPGAELNDKMRAFREYQYREMRDEEGKTLAERDSRGGKEPAALPDLGLDEEFGQLATVGVIYDEVDGLNFFPDFGLVEELFADPALIEDRRHRKALLGYLESPDIVPLPIVRLAERDLDRTNQLFRALLKRNHFDWATDGAALLQKYKAEYYQEPHYPGTMPVSERMSEVLGSVR